MWKARLMWKEWLSVAPATAVLGTMTACAQVADSSSSEDPQDARRAPVAYREHGDVKSVAKPPPAPPPGKRAEPPQDLMSRIAQDLSRRLNVNVAELQVLAVEPVTWSDGSLGCPQPGRSYVQAQTPGARVLFQHGGKSYQYHASERGHFVYCPNPSEPAGSYDRQ